MTHETLSAEALAVIDSFLHLKIGKAVAAIPYFNNKTVGAKFSIRARIGKGNAHDIADEVNAFLVKNRIPNDSLADETLKKILVDENLGIDCSGFTYYVLDEESKKRKLGALNKHLTFIGVKGPMGKMKAYLRPVENCDVTTFASDMNSRVISTGEIKAGDIITMTANVNGNERNHILVVHAVDSENGATKKIFYSDAVWYPEDGILGSGVKQGEIEITDPTKPITEQKWTENGLAGSDNRMYLRAKNSQTEVRRLKWF